MKKLNRTSLSALKSASTVLTKQQQRAIKGGCSWDEMGVGYWSGGNYYWYRTSECTCGSGGYSYDELDGSGCFYGYSGYNYWGGDDNWGNEEYDDYFCQVGGYYGFTQYIQGDEAGTVDCLFLCLAEVTGLDAKGIQEAYENWIRNHNSTLPADQRIDESEFVNKGVFFSDFEVVCDAFTEKQGKYTTNLPDSFSGTAIVHVDGHAVIALKAKDGYFIGYDPQNKRENGGSGTVSYSVDRIQQAYIFY